MSRPPVVPFATVDDGKDFPLVIQRLDEVRASVKYFAQPYIQSRLRKCSHKQSEVQQRVACKGDCIDAIWALPRVSAGSASNINFLWMQRRPGQQNLQTHQSVNPIYPRFNSVKGRSQCSAMLFRCEKNPIPRFSARPWTQTLQGPCSYGCGPFLRQFLRFLQRNSKGIHA